MKKLTKLLFVSALSLCAVGAFSANSAARVAGAEDFLCTYSAAERSAEYMAYGSSAVHTYTAEEAAAADIPEGYENEVLEVVHLSGSSNCGVLLDFSAEQVPLAVIDSLQFRVYIGYSEANTGSRPQVRIAQPGSAGNVWVYQPGETPTPAGEWTTVTVENSSAFVHIAENGTLNKFELGVRCNAQVPFYIDSIRYVLKENDGVAPVIHYAGEDTIAIELGGALSLPVSATDAQEGEMDVQYVWEEGVALNENGTPLQKGLYALTLVSVDYYGNKAEKTVTVKVIESDTVAPVIGVNYTEIKTTVGTKPSLKATATDDSGVVTVNTSWSDGALDKRGRLTAGTHTWTIVASDAFGNKTEKKVTFIVTEEEPAYSFVTNEEKLIGKHTVTFDGENAIEVSDGFTVERPADPVRETTAEAVYKFLGWYVDGAEWDFENTPVTKDLNIVSKWEETKRLYRVYFDGVAYGNKLTYGSLIPANGVPTEPEKEATEKEEYVFAGWYVGDKLWNFETDTITGDMQFEAKFTATPRKYTVTFDGKDAREYAYGDKVTEPETPTKEATETYTYEFLGWYNGEAKWDFNTDTVKKDTDLVAKWKEVALDGENAGSGDSDTDGSDTSQPGSGSVFDGLLGGCTGSVGGIACGAVALGMAVVALFKKKEN